MRLRSTKVDVLRPNGVELGGAFVKFSLIRVANKSSDQALFNGGCTSADGLQLIEGEFAVGHWIDCGAHPSDAHTISRINGRGNDRQQAVM